MFQEFINNRDAWVYFFLQYQNSNTGCPPLKCGRTTPSTHKHTIGKVITCIKVFRLYPTTLSAVCALFFQRRIFFSRRSVWCQHSCSPWARSSSLVHVQMPPKSNSIMVQMAWIECLWQLGFNAKISILSDPVSNSVSPSHMISHNHGTHGTCEQCRDIPKSFKLFVISNRHTLFLGGKVNWW